MKTQFCLVEGKRVRGISYGAALVPMPILK